jgi:GNAT superfamily N-acetyltransferase
MLMAALVIRDAGPEDAGTILGLIRELAAFEQEPDAVVATEADLRRDGWGAVPRFYCRLAVLDHVVCGYALWFFNYSTWRGRVGLYLEDLYVTPAARGQGVGERLVRDVARIALGQGAGRLDFNVLDWNPARGFYARLGIHELAGWRPYRLEAAGLAELAGQLSGGIDEA